MKKTVLALMALIFSVTAQAQLPINFVNNTNTSQVHLLNLTANGTFSATGCNSCAAELRTNVANVFGPLLSGQSLRIVDFANNSAGISLDWYGGPSGLCSPCTGAQANALCTNPNPSPPNFTHISFRIGPPYYSGFCKTPFVALPNLPMSWGHILRHGLSLQAKLWSHLPGPKPLKHML